jgi:O-antigen ligase
MFKNHPVTGMGSEPIGSASRDITGHQAKSARNRHHNDYLELLASGGLIACALLIWFLVLSEKRRGIV